MLSYTSARGISSGPPRIGSRTGFPSRGPSRPGRAFYLLATLAEAPRSDFLLSRVAGKPSQRAPHPEIVVAGCRMVSDVRRSAEKFISDSHKRCACASELERKELGQQFVGLGSNATQTFVRKSCNFLTGRLED